MAEIKKSFVTRAAVEKTKRFSAEAFRAVNGRNPNSQEMRKIEKSVIREAEKLNRR